MRIRALALICSFSVILSAVLAGCGGGGGSDGPPPGGGSSEDTSDAATRQALQTTNLDYGPAGSPALGTLKRWSLPIPVKANDPRATQAMDAIEARLGMGAIIFDRTSIAGADDSTITRGLIVMVGSAPPQAPLCGAVDFPDGDPAEIDGKFFIHIDSAGACTASVAGTIHEFAHTMGAFIHFQNFDDANPIGELFWRVFRTVYSNPIGTPGASIALAP